MKDQYLIRSHSLKLRRRFDNVYSAGPMIFRSKLGSFWHWLHEHDLTRSILDQAKLLDCEAQPAAQKIMGGETILITTENEEISVSYWVLRACIESDLRSSKEIYIGGRYGVKHTENDMLRNFKDVFLKPLVEYIDEQINDQRALLAILNRYKKSSEWFNQCRLFSVYKQESERGKIKNKNSRAEKKLALDLYEYLYEQGIEFSIEPWSVSGEAGKRGSGYCFITKFR